jgi:tetratricopeptide (TPR) repeat protein
LAAEARPVEPPVVAHGDAGGEEFQVPVEPAPDDSEIPATEQPAENPVHAEEPLHVEQEIGQHPEALLPAEELTELPVPEHAEVAAEGQDSALEEPQAALPKQPPSLPELELDQEFELVLEPEEVAAPYEMLSEVPPAKAPESALIAAPPEEKIADSAPAQKFTSDQFLSDLAKEIDELGLDELTPTMSKPDAEHEAVEPAKERIGASTETGPLKEVFDEFRAELGEMGAEDEDLETHYNLGIAFREMGLLEEAIGEFQKVAKANDRGKAFRYAMQCSTLLGLAFMEKGQPDIAAIWYERALSTPGLDSESKLALRYDLGVAQESAGDLEAALKSFSQVYAVNIDYRDVADRIASLQKPAR